MQQNDYLQTEKNGKLLVKFAVPCVCSLLISALYNIVDQIFIGNSDVGTIGNTATSIVYPIICIALACGLMLGDGAAAFASLCMGRKQQEKVSRTVGTCLVCALVISAVFLAICFPMLDNILVFFGAQTKESLTASREYAVWILVGMPFFILLNALNPVVRADGAPKIAMASNLSGCILNIILDYVFIFPMEMGLMGAALATSIGIVVSFLISAVYIFRARNFRLKISDFKPDFQILGRVIKLGFSSFLTQFAIVVITIVSMNMLAKYGADSKYGVNDPQAIIGVVMKVFSIPVNVAVGIAAGAQPIVSYNYGAKNYSKVRSIFKLVMCWVVGMGAVFTVLFQTIPVPIVKIFGSDSQTPELYLEFGKKAVRIYLMLIIFTLVQKTCSIFLQSIECPVKSVCLSLIRDVIAFVPFTLALPAIFGLDGVLWAAPAADIFGLAFSIIFVAAEYKKMKKNI